MIPLVKLFHTCLVSYLADCEWCAFILVYINDFLDVICSIVICVNDISLYFNCDMVACSSSLSWLLKLNLTSKDKPGLESGMLISMVEKLNMVLFDHSNNWCYRCERLMVLALIKSPPLKCWECLSHLYWIGYLTLPL